MSKRKEYIWMEKEQCPYCDKRMTNGRLIRHVCRKHTDEQFTAFMEQQKHKWDGLLAAIKSAEEIQNGC